MSDSSVSSTSSSAVAFLIDAPLQAWGASSRFQYRETEAFPTKSALLGLVAAALGIDKHGPDEAERLAELAALRATVCALPRRGKGETLRLTDFHTIGGGYPDRMPEKLNCPPTAEKTKSGGLKWKTPDKRTVPTYRTYLTDARFIAALEGSGTTVQNVADALSNPVWGIWFGRKTCLPALPLAPTKDANSTAALESLLERVAEWDGGAPCDPAALERWEEPVEVDPTEGDFHLADSPVSFGDRIFTSRPVRHHRPNRGGENAS